MASSKWVTADRWMREVHLYTGLFLAPWMLIYAVSAFCLLILYSLVIACFPKREEDSGE